MTSREKILSAVRQNQPGEIPMPDIHYPDNVSSNIFEQFVKTVTGIGGEVIHCSGYPEIQQHLQKRFPEPARIINTINELSGFETIAEPSDPHTFSNVSVTVMRGNFGVAENGAIWLNDKTMVSSALPYISEHLALVLHQKDLVMNLHQAYDRIGLADYHLGTFIAGPSKTADIEQSLVLGAHGPKSLIVFLVD